MSKFKVGDIVKYDTEYILSFHDGILPKWYNRRSRFIVYDGKLGENDSCSNVTVYRMSKSSSKNIYTDIIWCGFLKLDISYIRKTKLEKINKKLK